MNYTLTMATFYDYKLYFNKTFKKDMLVLIKKQCQIIISASKGGKNPHLVRGYGFFREGNNCSHRNLFRKFWATLLKRNVQLYILLMPTVSLEAILAFNSIHPFSKSHRVLSYLPSSICQTGGDHEKWEVWLGLLTCQHFKTCGSIRSLALPFLATVLSLWLQSQNHHCFRFVISLLTFFSF